LSAAHQDRRPEFRECQWTQFPANLATRLESGATVIIVATCWHFDDLIGRETGQPTLAGGDWTVGGLLTKHTPSSGCYIMNMKRKQLSSANVEKMVHTTAEADGRDVTNLIEQERGSSGKTLAEHDPRNVLPDFRVVPIATGAVPKLSRAPV